MATLRVISFACGDQYYLQHAERLRTECNKFNIPYDIVIFDTTDPWIMNCRKKPAFILNKLKHYGEGVLWLDVDSVIVKPFSVSFDNGEDVGIVPHDFKIQHTPPLTFAAGCLAFNFTQNAIGFLSMWQNLCDEAKISADHRLLQLTYNAWLQVSGFKVMMMPQAMFYHPSLTPKVTDPIIKFGTSVNRVSSIIEHIPEYIL